MIIDFNIVPYDDKYLDEINKLNSEEGWHNLVEHKATFKNALNQSNAYVAVDNESNVLGYIRTITDQFITLFICELLVKMSYRSNGLGRALINKAHRQYPTTRIELLATKVRLHIMKNINLDRFMALENHRMNSFNYYYDFKN